MQTKRSDLERLGLEELLMGINYSSAVKAQVETNVKPRYMMERFTWKHGSDGSHQLDTS